MQRNARWFLAMVLVMAALAMTYEPVMAQAARSSSGNAQAMQQMQQLAAERTRLLADNAKLQTELEAARKERDALRKQHETSARRLQGTDAVVARASAKSESLAQELEREKTRMAELVAKFRETVGQFREVESDRNTIKAALGKRDVELEQCIDRNVSLYSLSTEILTKLEHRGTFTPASALEPFTRLKRVELENLIDGYQSRAEEQRPPTG